jgi:hypothetical protein
MPERTIRASELASYTYCARAWWYGIHGEVPANQAALDDGIRWHVELEKRTRGAMRMRVVGLGLVSCALLLALISLTWNLLS